MFSPENIKWVKSVKRNGGTGWAYNDISCYSEEPQKLHWRNAIGKTAAKHPKVGDIILLFQTVNNETFKNIVRLTHLVSPISEDVLIDTKNKNFKWYREILLIAKAEPIHTITKPRILKFGKVGNGGLTFPIDLLSNEKIDTGSVQKLIWGSFANFICPDFTNNTNLDTSLIEFAGAKEGDTRIISHIKQEFRYRNRDIVKQKKADALADGNGRLKCECCSFDFFGMYGEVGREFMECHHKIFLQQGERITKLEDLALVCSNCHRMLHRKKANNEYYSLDEIRELLKQTRV
jgi:hypothetical protein